MQYKEAKELAENWTLGHDISLDGWRTVVKVLLDRVSLLEGANQDLNASLHRMQRENEALALDLGIKEQDFRLPPQPQLRTIADIIKEVEGKP
jgi:hypothetical protein